MYNIFFEEWSSIPPIELQRLVESMPRRIKAAVVVHGGNSLLRHLMLFFFHSKLYIQTGEVKVLFCCICQVGIYLLEAGLGKPEFLSEGNARLKKANQLMQKLMEYFYDFIIPGKCLFPMSGSFCDPCSPVTST